MSAGLYSVLLGGVKQGLPIRITTDETLDLQVNQSTVVFPDFKAFNNPNSLIGSDIQILRDSVAFWRGIVMRYESRINAQNFRDFTLTCSSNKIYIDRELFRKGGLLAYSYGGTQSGSGSLSTQSTLATDIFKDILACQYSTVLNAGNLGTSNIPHATMLIVRTKAMQALQNLVNASLWETRFNPDNTVDFLPQVGSSTPIANFVEGESIFDIDYAYGIENYLNDPVVCGAGSATGTFNKVTDNQVIAEPTGSFGSLGRWSKAYNFPSIADKNTLTAYANALQKDLENPLYTIQCIIYSTLPGVAFKIGDNCTVSSPSLGLSNAIYRIIRIRRTFDANEEEQITLILQPNARQVSLTHAKLKSLTYILNSQTENAQLFNNSVNPNVSQLPLDSGTQSAYTSTGPETISDVYVFISISVSGFSNGGTFTLTATPDTGVVVDSTDITDTKTNTVYPSGAFTADIFDHSIQFHAHYTNTNSGAQAGCTVTGRIQLNSPTIPT